MSRSDDRFSRLAVLGESGSPGRHGDGGMRRLALFAAVIIVPALALLALWRVADGRRGASEPLDLRPDAVQDTGRPVTEPLRTRLLSFRRTPALLADDTNRAQLTAAVRTLSSRVGERSCLTVSLDGTDVQRVGADRPVVPASSMKVIVAAVALERLGRDHRFTTTLVGTVAGSTVVGDLTIVGGGDPLLTSDAFPIENDPQPVVNETSLDALAIQLAEAGVTTVEGDVVGDESRYDDERYAPDWVPADRDVEAGPLGALMVNDARVTASGVHSEDPSLGAAQEFVDVLGAQGIEVLGSARAGSAPAGAEPIATVESSPLHAVVAEMLTTSDDNTAELLVKELGIANGSAGTREGGLAVVRAQLDEWGADVAGTSLTDGSGLSATNLVTCNVLQMVLVDSGHADDLAAGMAIAGETGTLSDVFGSSSVAGRMRAKTGTLANLPADSDPPASKALVGYVPSGRRHRIEFSLVLNGPTVNDPGQYLPVWETLAATLGEYPAGPTARALGPRR